MQWISLEEEEGNKRTESLFEERMPENFQICWKTQTLTSKKLSELQPG